jgi:hypothetical protein
MTEVFRIRREFEQLWKRENKRIDVTVTSAVELDPAVVAKDRRGDRAADRPEVELASRVDDRDPRRHRPAGRQHGLDASIRSRLEKLRKSVAQAA